MNRPGLYKSESDLDAMRELLSAGKLAQTAANYIHPGDLNWWWYYHDRDRVFPGRTHTWEEDGRMIGWGLDWDGDLNLFVVPELCGTSLAAEMVFWGLENLLVGEKGGIPSMSSVSDRDLFLVGLLEGQGYQPREKHLVHHSLELGEIAAPQVPPGYCVSDMSAGHAPASRAKASKLAFSVKRAWDLYLPNYIRFTRSPVYSPVLDVVAVAPDGEVAAFAICWLDPISRTGLFEPVGTHPEYQHRGLGRAVLLEGLRRMKVRGMVRAEVSTYSDNPAALGLYGSIGFEVDCNLMTYERK